MIQIKTKTSLKAKRSFDTKIKGIWNENKNI